MKIHISIIGSLLTLVGVTALSAHAQQAVSPFTGSVAITSDYTFRGLSQTNRMPALQGGMQFDNSGLYVGLWGSNISWLSDYEDVSSSVEIDVYGGYKGTFADDWSYDVGLIRYQYPGNYPTGFTSPNTTEVYGSIGWKTLSARISYSLSDAFGFSDSRNSDYIEVNWNQPLAGSWSLNAHVGKQTIDGLADANYTDYKLGVTVALAHGFSLAAAYIDTNAEDSVYTNVDGKFLGKQTGVVTLTKAF